MADARGKLLRGGKIHPVVDLCAWSVILALGIWQLLRSPGHLGGFSVWFQIAVSVMSIVAATNRILSGYR